MMNLMTIGYYLDEGVKLMMVKQLVQFTLHEPTKDPLE
jgi:hypothetical protein